MSDETVWDRTHRFGGRLFKAAGILSIASILSPSHAYLIIIALVLSAALASVVYSYILFSKSKKKKPIKGGAAKQLP